MRGKNVLEIGMAQGQNIDGIIFNELAIEIIGHGAVIQALGQRFDRFIVQPHIQDRFHVTACLAIHAWPHGEEQGLQFFQCGCKISGSWIGDDEALWNRQAEVQHGAQASGLGTERCRTFSQRIYRLFRHIAVQQTRCGRRGQVVKF